MVAILRFKRTINDFFVLLGLGRNERKVFAERRLHREKMEGREQPQSFSRREKNLARHALQLLQGSIQLTSLDSGRALSCQTIQFADFPRGISTDAIVALGPRFGHDWKDWKAGLCSV